MKRFSLLLGLLLIVACKKTDKPVDTTKAELAKFVPHGWIVEFDTSAPILDHGRMGHVLLLEEYDTVQKKSTARMLSIVGPDANGKWQRFAANTQLLQSKDLTSQVYVPTVANTIKVRKDVISIMTHTSGISGGSYASREEFKIRYDPSTQRFKLIGYDLTDVTDGVTTIDSRNYPMRNRVVESREGKDTLFHRLVKLRHTAPFLEDLEPFQLAVAPELMMKNTDYIPETTTEAEVNYQYSEPDPIDSSTPSSTAL